jgi:undecaprenyl-diphosphatase
METAGIREDGGAAPDKGKGLIARVVATDHAFLRLLGSIPMSRSVTLPLIALVRIGDGWIWCLVAGYLWWATPFLLFKQMLLHCLLAIAISLAVYWPIKLLVRRPRPYNCGLGVTARVPPLDRYSFPSGHTMNNLAVALTLSVYLPDVFLAALGVPVLLGALRILFGVHFLSDITGGVVLGVGSFLLARLLFVSFPI